MIHSTFAGCFRLAPDPEQSAGVDPFVGSSTATDDAPGVPAMGEDSGYNEPGVSPFGDDAKPAAPAEVKTEGTASRGGKPDGDGSFVIPDDEEAILTQVFDVDFIKETGQKFGKEGIAHLLAQAKAKAPEGGAPEETDDTPAPEGGKKTEKPDPSALDVGDIGLKPEAIQAFKDVVGDDAYNQFMEPLVKHASKQAAAIKQLTTGIRQLVASLNEVDNHRIMDRLKDSALGDSEGENGLSESHKRARDKVLSAARAYITQNPRASVASALRFGLNTIKPANKVGTGRPMERSGMVGAVPSRSSSAQIRSGGGKSIETARSILSQGMKALGYTS